MRKFFAILLLSLLLFNFVGYRALFTYLETKAQSQMESLMDKQAVNTHDLFEIKIPLNIPYIANTNSFERFNGSVKVNGVFYSYFERKISNDTLILLCIINTEENRLSKMKTVYAGLDKDIQNKSKSRSAALFFGLIKSKYNQQDFSCNSFATHGSKKSYPEFKAGKISNAFVLSPEQPPELA
jgi:hypothetical protein